VTALAIWQSLDAVHQRTLQIVYQVDQLVERYEYELRADGHYGRPPASEWRWLFLEPLTGECHPDRALEKYLREARLLAKAQPILDDLVSADLLEYRLKRFPRKPSASQYQITRLGRRVVRAGIGEVREKPLPTGTLREHHWRALEMAFRAGDAGLESTGHGYYGSLAWRTWVRLRNYKAGSLVEERGGDRLWDNSITYVDGAGHLREFTPQTPYRLCITEFGKTYFIQERARYQALYPEKIKNKEIL
jgi:hypothetical protein